MLALLRARHLSKSQWNTCSPVGRGMKTQDSSTESRQVDGDPCYRKHGPSSCNVTGRIADGAADTPMGTLRHAYSVTAKMTLFDCGGAYDSGNPHLSR